ncbi:MAG: T9SS type A sorting domain-containing protein [Bacteroidales bacterium]|nr:T9SS type A sorting domain-containing protein [Bacteroidales bacterium]
MDNGVEIYTGVSNQPFRMSELELSHDGSRLAFSRTDVSGNCNVNQDVVIFELNPTTGNLSNSTPITINLRSNDDNLCYPGIEFSADGQSLYVLAENGGLWRVLLSNYTNSQMTALTDYSYCNSQLELGRDGWFYLAKSDGLYRMDADGNVYLFSSGTMAYNDLMALRDCTVYVLPDQIDGQDYKTYTPTEDCCYAYNESFIKTPNMSGVSHASNGDITITGSNVSWTQASNPFTSGGQPISDIYLKGELKINQGARLNILGLTLHFKEGESLEMPYSTNSTVAGPKLYLYSGSKLTVFDECNENALWGGIKCRGWWGPGFAQSGVPVVRQPLVYVSNSTIEFAEMGIDVSCGGIVYGKNSFFKDNIYDVSFSSWSIDNISYFTTCKFYTTGDLYNKGRNPEVHAHMWTAPGLAFIGCEFINEYASSVPVYQRGVGILSTSSSLDIVEKCSSIPIYGTPCPDANTTRGNFTGLYYGIKAGVGSFMKLSKQDFSNCVKGTWLMACDAITVTECDFDVSSETLASSLLYDSFGLYVESSTGYHIEENNFHDGVLGMVILNSGRDENLIYRNDFVNLSGNQKATGFVGLGINYDCKVKSGLQLWCNNFTDVDYAMAVLGGDVITPMGAVVNITHSDIRTTQGMIPACGTQICAHNSFSGIPTNEDRFFVVEPSVSQQQYWYHQCNDVAHQLGTHASNIHTIYRPDQLIPCPQTIYSGGGGGGIIMQTIGGFNDEEIGLENEIASLTSYDKLNLEISAQSANTNNTTAIYNNLYEASPYLTSKILLAYLNNTNVSELSRTSLMLANSPLPSDVVEALQHADISASYKAYILKAQNGENLIEQKLNSINRLKSARQVNYDKLIRETLYADSTPDFAATYNAVIDFMETQTDLHAKKKLADLYIHKGLYDNALTTLCDLESIALSEDNVALFNDVKIKEIQIDMYRTHATEAAQNVISENEQYLRELASDYNTKEGGAARAMLASADLWDNFPIVILPNPQISVNNKSAKINNEYDETELIPELESLFSIYPNPANNYLSIEFINPDGNCTFSIYTIKGDFVKTINTNQQLGFMSIDISDLKAGNYIINCKELNENQSFIIAR